MGVYITYLLSHAYIDKSIEELETVSYFFVGHCFVI